jgi:hypothetical protein
VDDQRLGDDRTHVEARIERRKRVLKDHLHVAPLGAQRGGAEGQQIRTVEYDLSRSRLDEPQDGAPQGRLSATGLPHHAECLAVSQGKIDAVDRAYAGLPMARRKLLG